MRKILSLLVVVLCTISSRSADYTDYLTTQRGFTEVTSTSDILTGDYYYVITSAENTEMIVTVGPYAAKPGWASENTKALHYKAVSSNPVVDRMNIFTIEQRDEYYALFSVAFPVDAFQTHDGASYMYVNTFTCQDSNVKEWGGLTPAWNDGYWTFEEGKYPGNFLGPWNKIVADGEAIAGNRTNVEGDEAGHYRLFRISKSDLQNAQIEGLQAASSSAPLDATFLITNPSFETGNYTGWTPTGDVENNGEIGAKTSVTSYSDGNFTFNSFQWWSGLSVSQTTYVPSGIYDVSAVVAAWEIDDVTFSANTSSVTNVGQGDMTGIPVTLQSIVVKADNSLTISASSNADWWSEGRSTETNWQYACGFFKLDNVRLTCKGLFLSAVAQPLPNDETTVLAADQWYYYDTPASGKYTLTGNLLGLSYTTQDDVVIPDITTQKAKQELGFDAGRVFFKTTRSDATLKVEPTMEINTFTAASLNVDGLPQSVNIIFTNIDINPDGPGESGTELISTYLQNKGYDMIAVSEDFNYHSNLTKNMSSYSWGTYRGSLSLSNALSTADTDGLEFAWKSNALTVRDESWTKFNTSEGGLRDGANTSIKKGYRYYTANVNGVDIDVFITHMDADGENSHTSSRNAQWTEMANAIKAKNNGRPKIFMGDTNSRWTRENIKTNFMDVLSEDYDIQDTWVEMHREGNYDGLVDESGYGWGIVNDSDPTKFSAYEVVDKIFYLNPKADNTYRLHPTSWKLELDYTKGDGTQLGDHKPVVVDFAIAYSEAVDNTVIPGDIVDGDGMNATDLEALINILMGRAESTYDLNAADLNGDGEITLSDLTALVNILLPEGE